MPYSIQIASGENTLLQALHANGAKDYVSIQPLPVGDALIIDAQANVHYIVERKTVSDLWSSFLDGRFSDQKRRIKEVGVQAVYVIEGDITRHSNYNELFGAIRSLQQNSGFMVFQTLSTTGTALALIQLAKSTELKPKSNTPLPPLGVTSLKMKKPSEEITPRTFFKYSLCLIPRISTATAEEIASEYKSMPKLVQELKTESGFKRVSSIKIGNGKKRCLGPSCTNHIKEFCEGMIENGDTNEENTV